MALLTDSKNLKQINWKKLSSYANPQAIKDLDQFLDRLPARVGMNNIIVASIVWAIAGASLLFVYTKSVDIQQMRKELTQAEALRPTVPVMSYTAVSAEAIAPHIAKIKTIYPRLEITQSGNEIKVISSSTREFVSWRAAINDIAYGANGWRAQVKDFCAGRECTGGPLQASLTIQELNITVPAAAETEIKS